MPERAPDSGEFIEKLNVGDLLSIGSMILQGQADGLECFGPRAEVSQNGASLAGGRVPIKVASGEATTTKLFRDLPKLLDEDIARQRIDAPSIKTELRTIHWVAPRAV
jgi:hypothetical protein